MRKIKGIFIDVENQDIREVIIEDELSQYYNLIKCDCIDCVMLDSKNDVIVDDEGLLKNPTKFFSIDDEREPQFAGNGLIVGNDVKTGIWKNTTLNIEDFRKHVTFFRLVKTPIGNILFKAKQL